MSLFRVDSPIFQFLERVANIIILNILFLVCCIPVVTIGPALTALYYVSMKMVRREETGIIRDFFHSCRVNFRQGVLLFLIVVGVGSILASDMYLLLYSSAIPDEYAKILLYVTGALCIVFFMIAVYIFPILSRFHVTVQGCIKASIGVAFCHLPTTVAVIAIALVPFLMLFAPVVQILQIFVPLLLLLGFSAMAYGQSWLLLRAFRRHTPDEQDEARNGEEG